ncbi:potassium channel family protein [Desulfoferrobacter suflitae]|uniref:potassium channel family protein n=1 Tax=Desulfoferrobacter suflitae TaxID=2865782 RepID=UPI002164BB76|nr:TrkA family potassium uptake protein [Desulfoferrobacter suflitae]MCK8601788.1 TrkA family potassium uptake protein [Desulfoferrobacter suflitae]
MKRFAVIGLGKFGFHVARTLYEEGNEVVAVDMDQSRIQEIDPVCTEALVLDARDKDRMGSLGLDEMDAVVVSCGEDISTSVLVTLYLQEIGVKRILAKAVDEDHGKILKKVGATEVIHPEKSMAVKVAQGLSRPNILDFIPLAEDYTLLQIAPPRAFIGKSLKQLNLRAKYNVHVIAIEEVLADNIVLVPPAEFVIKDSDILIMLGKAQDIKRIKDLNSY